MKVKNMFILLELILVCFLPGCSKVSGLDEQLIVYGIGIDNSEGIYELSVQAIDIKNNSESSSKEAQKKLTTISSKAPSLIEAEKQIENQSGKKMLYSHALILIIGEQTAKNGITDIVKFFSTNHKLRPTVEVLISNISAKDILANEKGENNSEDILALTKVGKENNDAINSNLRYILGDINDNLKAEKVWYLEYNEGQMCCEKISILKNSKLINILDDDDTKGAILCFGKAKNICDNIKINDKEIYYEINKAKANINFSVEKGKPIFYVSVLVTMNLYNLDNNISNEEVKPLIEKRLSNLIKNTINFCIKENNCDIFNFNKHIIKANADFFKANLNRIENIVASAEYDINVSTKIRYLGPNQDISALVY